MKHEKPPLRLVTANPDPRQPELVAAYCPECRARGFEHSHGVEIATRLLTNGSKVRRPDDSHTMWVCPICLAAGKVTALI